LNGYSAVDDHCVHCGTLSPATLIFSFNGWGIKGKKVIPCKFHKVSIRSLTWNILSKICLQVVSQATGSCGSNVVGCAQAKEQG
ncbi:hypothetical protein BMETH_24661393922460, partial [methanotrophic bacterial endosymbiont of Bathymodiolus sp.]